jgi:hypothetical protein
MGSEFPGQLALVGAVGIVSATLYGIAALWAVGGRANWLWRVAPLALLLAAWVPAGAYELLALFGVQSAVVVGAVLGLRIMRRMRNRWRASVSADGQSEASTLGDRRAFRFGLVDIVKAVLLAAAVLAIVRLDSPSTAVSLGVPIEWTTWCISGAGAGLVTLAAAYLVCGRPDRWYVRAIVFVLLTAVGGLLEVAIVASGLLFQLVDRSPPPWILICGPLQAILTAVWLLLLDGAGWAWWGDDVSMADHARRLRTRAMRVALGGLSLCGILLLGRCYWALLPPPRFVVEPLPKPNAYDELVRLGKTLDWSAIPDQDVKTASVSSCQTFLQDNAARLEAMRHALVRPCRNPADPNSPSFFANAPEYSSLRDLTAALEAEAKVAIADGDPKGAIQCYLEIIRLGQSTAVGGLADQHLISNVIEGNAHDGITGQVDHLDAAALQTLGRELEALDANREPLSAVLAREQNYRNLGTGWPGRLQYWTEEMLGLPNFTDEVMRQLRARVEARMSLLVAECAVRRYIMDNGSPPESLESLVPKYLSAVPQDPYGDGPLVYRRAPDGYLLYSVAANGTDDGGQRVSLNRAIDRDEPQGDMFFDAKWDSP